MDGLYLEHLLIIYIGTICRKFNRIILPFHLIWISFLNTMKLFFFLTRLNYSYNCNEFKKIKIKIEYYFIDIIVISNKEKKQLFKTKPTTTKFSIK